MKGDEGVGVWSWLTSAQHRGVDQDRYLRPLFATWAAAGGRIPPPLVLCRTLGRRARTMDRHSRRVLGSTLREFGDGVRVLEAVRKLVTTDDKLSRIADDVGCSCASVLQRAVRRHLGLTPGEVRACVLGGLDVEACIDRGDVRERLKVVRKRLKIVRKRLHSPLAAQVHTP